MTRCILTQALADELKPKDKLYDMTAIGHPGFGIRVLPSARKNWFYRFRIKNSVRMAILGQASWMKFETALKTYQIAKTKKDQGIEPKGVNPTLAEAEFLFYQLFKVFEHGNILPSDLQNEPTLEAFADYYKVHTAAVKKLAAYSLLKLYSKGEGVRVLPYPVAVMNAFWNGVEFRWKQLAVSSAIRFFS